MPDATNPWLSIVAMVPAWAVAAHRQSRGPGGLPGLPFRRSANRVLAPVPARRPNAGLDSKYVGGLANREYREIWPLLVLSGGPWGERIGPVWSSAFIYR